MKKLIIALAITMVLATGCTSAPATDTADTYNYNDTSYEYNEGDDYYTDNYNEYTTVYENDEYPYTEDDYYDYYDDGETYDCSQCVYTGLEDDHLVYYIQRMMQICSYSEDDAVYELGYPSDAGGGWYLFENGAFLEKYAIVTITADYGDVKEMTWCYTYPDGSEADRAECIQIYKDLRRVLETEMYVTNGGDNADGDNYASYSCCYNGYEITIERSCSGGFVQLYIEVSEY